MCQSKYVENKPNSIFHRIQINTIGVMNVMGYVGFKYHKAKTMIGMSKPYMENWNQAYEMKENEKKKKLRTDSEQRNISMTFGIKESTTEKEPHPKNMNDLLVDKIIIEFCVVNSNFKPIWMVSIITLSMSMWFGTIFFLTKKHVQIMNWHACGKWTQNNTVVAVLLLSSV